MLRLTLSLIAISFVVLGWLSIPAQSGQIFAGGFSFSDELGGFRLISATGKGTAKEPFVIVEEIFDGLPAILIIRRRTGFSQLPSWKPGAGSKLIYVRKIIRNLTNRVWTGFDLELRQILDEPSRYEDGLSFNQVTREQSDVTSDRFARHHRRFEPRDSIRFEQGHVDTGAQLTLRLPISDTTPVGKFYLMQEPIYLSVASNKAIDLTMPVSASGSAKRQRSDCHCIVEIGKAGTI